MKPTTLLILATFFFVCKTVSGQISGSIEKLVEKAVKNVQREAEKTIKKTQKEIKSGQELKGAISTQVFQKVVEYELLIRKYPLLEKYPVKSDSKEPFEPLENKAYKTSSILRWCRELMASVNYLIKKSDEMNYSQNWKTTNWEIEYAAEQLLNIISSLDSINRLVDNEAAFQSLKVKAINVKGSLDLIQNKSDIKELLDYDFENSAVQETLYDNLKKIFSKDFPPLAVQGNDLMDNVYAILTNLDKQLKAQND